MSSQPTVLVTGATGAQGGAVVSELLSGGKVSIKAMTRNPSSSKAVALASQGVQVVKADLGDADSLRSALTGVDRAFLVTEFSGPEGVEGETKRGKQFVQLAQEQGVKHVVFTSVGSAEQKTGVPHFESKFLVEEALRASKIPSWTILRPVGFMDNFPPEPSYKRALFLGMFGALLGGKKLQMIAVKDIGWFAARALESPEQWKGQAITLAGDELDIEGMRDAFGRAQGQRAGKIWLPGTILGAIVPNEMGTMFKFFREKGYNADIAALRKIHPGLLTFEQWIKSKSQ